MTTHRVTDRNYAVALAAGRAEAETEFRALAVRYVADRDAIEITTSRQAGFLIPRSWIGALQDVPVDALQQLQVWPDGSAIELAELDIQISVTGLLAAILPAMLPTQAVTAMIASQTNEATSKRRDGRPRKPSLGQAGGV